MNDTPGPTSPTPPGVTVISASNVTSTSLTLSWQSGNDNSPGQPGLFYKVVESTNPDIDTIAGAEAAQVIVLRDFTENVTTIDIQNLTPGTTYYFNVILKDAAGHKSIYTMFMIIMTEKDPPSPGNYGLVDTTYPKATEQDIVWTKGTDAVDTDSSVLEYKLVRSTNPNISTVAEIEALGQVIVVMDWTKDTSIFTDSGLTGGTNYYYNVLIRDTQHNMSAYSMTLIPTPISEAEVFVFSPGDSLESRNFTGVNYFDPITPEGYMETTTHLLDPGTVFLSSFKTPLFSDMDRNIGSGFAIEWKVQYLSSRWTGGYAEMNKFQMKLLNRNGVVLYTVLWMPIPDAADRGHYNRGLFKGTSEDLSSNYQEQHLYPTGLNTPKWVSFRMELNSAGITVRNNLTADYTTTTNIDGNPDWSVIPAESPAQIVSSDTTNNHIDKIQFEYNHFGDYSIQVKDFSIKAIQ